MPGHKKHTKATKPSWTLGDAYQGVRQGPTLKDLYIHPLGRGGSPW